VGFVYGFVIATGDPWLRRAPVSTVSGMDSVMATCSKCKAKQDASAEAKKVRDDLPQIPSSLLLGIDRISRALAALDPDPDPAQIDGAVDYTGNPIRRGKARPNLRAQSDSRGDHGARRCRTEEVLGCRGPGDPIRAAVDAI